MNNTNHYSEEFVPRTSFKPLMFKGEISQLPTRLLMKFRKQFQAFSGVEDFTEFEYLVPAAGKATRMYIITKKAVLAELSTREHIFNKLEARKLRQIMAATGLTKEQVVDNPTYYKQIVNG